MEETNTLLDGDAALKPLLELAQASNNVSLIRTAVLKALSDPKVFAGFDEIKSIVQPRLESSGTEASSILSTLDLFSYGTYNDYRQAPPGHYLALSDSQIFKLRQLTILTLVGQACSDHDKSNFPPAKAGMRGRYVPYETLARELGFSEEASAKNASPVMNDAVLRQVEEVVLSCVYARIVAGQLCQKSAAFFVTARHGPPCRSRDVPLSQGSKMLEILKQFHQGRLDQARKTQGQKQVAVQSALDAILQNQNTISEQIRNAQASNGGSGNNPALVCGGTVRGWPEGQDERRLSMTEMGGSARGSTSRRQTKRSRGGVAGSFGRY